MAAQLGVIWDKLFGRNPYVENKEERTEGCKESEVMETEIVEKEDIKLPAPWSGKLAYVLHNVYTQEECRDLITKTESMGYEEALINTGRNTQQRMPEVRNSKRCIWDSVEEAGKMWQRIKHYIPTEFKGCKVVGLNERLRFLKYDPGEYFKPHMDGEYRRPDNIERSYITVHLYLNQGFQGGSTTFLGSFGSTDGKRVECVPRTGSILIFQHDILHEGSELIDGRKYTVRTDVMYAPKHLTK